MNTTYLALLRGVNVGGNNMIKMAELKEHLEQASFEAVQTYIQSGNVLFQSKDSSTSALARKIEQVIADNFKLKVEVAVFSKTEWAAIIAAAPKTWGVDTEWKHNILVMLEPFDMEQIVADYGELKPDIEALDVGKGVLYQSISFKMFGRSRAGKLAANPIYKRMTIRNYNTAVKLQALLEASK